MTEDEELAFEEEMLNRRKALAAAVKSSDFLTTFRASTGMLGMCETQEEKQKRETQEDQFRVTGMMAAGANRYSSSARNVEELTHMEVTALRNIFNGVAGDDEGTLDGPIDLRNALSTMKIEVDEATAAKMVAEADADGDGQIDFDE